MHCKGYHNRCLKFADLKRQWIGKYWEDFQVPGRNRIYRGKARWAFRLERENWVTAKRANPFKGQPEGKQANSKSAQNHRTLLLPPLLLSLWIWANQTFV